MCNPPTPPFHKKHKLFHKEINKFSRHIMHNNRTNNHFNTDNINYPQIIDPNNNDSIYNTNLHDTDPIKITDSTPVHSNNTLNGIIQFYEIRNAIAVLKTHKAYGPDKIHNLMIIKGGEPLWRSILILFNKCLKTGQFPKCFNFANILPIPKPNDSETVKIISPVNAL